MRNWWNNTKNYIEQKGAVWVLAFVGLCWLRFAAIIDLGETAIIVVGILFVLLAVLSYRFLRLFMR